MNKHIVDIVSKYFSLKRIKQLVKSIPNVDWVVDELLTTEYLMSNSRQARMM